MSMALDENFLLRWVESIKIIIIKKISLTNVSTHFNANFKDKSGREISWSIELEYNILEN